jgi:hypothetical protein
LQAGTGTQLLRGEIRLSAKEKVYLALAVAAWTTGLELTIKALIPSMVSLLLGLQ